MSTGYGRKEIVIEFFYGSVGKEYKFVETYMPFIDELSDIESYDDKLLFCFDRYGCLLEGLLEEFFEELGLRLTDC